MIKRLLIIPAISTITDVWRECNFIIWTRLVKAWKDVFCYFPIYEKADIPKEYYLDNIEFVKLKHWYPFNSSLASISSELYEMFNVIDGKYPVDAIITSRTPVGAPTKRLFYFSPNLFLPTFKMSCSLTK